MASLDNLYFKCTLVDSTLRIFSTDTLQSSAHLFLKEVHEKLKEGRAIKIKESHSLKDIVNRVHTIYETDFSSGIFGKIRLIWDHLLTQWLGLPTQRSQIRQAVQEIQQTQLIVDRYPLAFFKNTLNGAYDLLKAMPYVEECFNPQLPVKVVDGSLENYIKQAGNLQTQFIEYTSNFDQLGKTRKNKTNVQQFEFAKLGNLGTISTAFQKFFLAVAEIYFISGQTENAINAFKNISCALDKEEGALAASIVDNCLYQKKFSAAEKFISKINCDAKWRIQQKIGEDALKEPTEENILLALSLGKEITKYDKNALLNEVAKVCLQNINYYHFVIPILCDPYLGYIFDVPLLIARTTQIIEDCVKEGKNADEKARIRLFKLAQDAALVAPGNHRDIGLEKVCKAYLEAKNKDAALGAAALIKNSERKEQLKQKHILPFMQSMLLTNGSQAENTKEST